MKTSSLSKIVIGLFVSLIIISGLAGLTQAAEQKAIILATTTSTQDSGLLDVLIPRFEKEQGYFVKTIAVGSGQAMVLGQKGEADVLLVPNGSKELIAFANPEMGLTHLTWLAQFLC